MSDQASNPEWHDALQRLLRQHTPFHPADTDDFKELTRQSSALEKLFLENEQLRSYYAGCMGITCTSPAPLTDPCDTVHAAAMQLQLMEDVFFSLRLYQYANAPDNRGWMNLFRSWGRYDLFQQHFRELSANYSKQFVRFYEDYIENWPPIDTHPVPHGWDLATTLPDFEIPPDDELLPEELERLRRLRGKAAAVVANYTGETKWAAETVAEVASARGREINGIWLDRGRRAAGVPLGDAPGGGGQPTKPAPGSHGEDEPETETE